MRFLRRMKINAPLHITTNAMPTRTHKAVLFPPSSITMGSVGTVGVIGSTGDIISGTVVSGVLSSIGASLVITVLTGSVSANT